MTRPKVILQAGHSASFAPFKTNGGGAPSEAAWTAKLVMLMTPLLTARGVDVVAVGTWLVSVGGQMVNLPPPPAATQDADLFLSFHYDAAVYGNSSGNSGAFADRAAKDPVGHLSDLFISRWEQIYFPATGLRNAKERRNVNTSNYYAFRDTSPKTPGVILEFGVGAPGAGGDAVLLWDFTDKVAYLTANAVVQYLIAEGRLEPEAAPDPHPDVDPPEEGEPATPDEIDPRAEWLAQLGEVVRINPDTAIVKRALEAALAGEWRGPFVGDEYPSHAYDDGEETVRQKQTAGIVEYRPSTGRADYVEIVLHPEALSE